MPSSRRLALKKKTFCPTATGKMTARELFLTLPQVQICRAQLPQKSRASSARPQTNEFQPECGHMRYQSHHLLPGTLPWDKNAVTGDGWPSSLTCSSVSSQLTTFTVAGTRYRLSNGQVAHTEHMEVSVCACPALPTTEVFERTVSLGPPPHGVALLWSTGTLRPGAHPPTRHREPHLPRGLSALLAVSDSRERPSQSASLRSRR